MLRSIHTQLVKHWRAASKSDAMEGFRSALCLDAAGSDTAWRCYGKRGYDLHLVQCDPLSETADLGARGT